MLHNEFSTQWTPPSSAGSDSTDASLAFSSPAHEFGTDERRRISFRDLSSSLTHHRAPAPAQSLPTPRVSMPSPSLRSAGSYGRVRSGSSASRPQPEDASSMTPSMRSWTHATAASQPAASKRSSLLGALSFSFSGRRPTSKRSQRQSVVPDYNEYYGEVIEITAVPTEDELERERLRTAAAQAVGLAIPKPPSPELILQPLPPPPLPPFPATLAMLAPRASLSAQVSKRSATAGFLGRVNWKQRLVMLTTRDMHTFIGQNEVERMELMTSSVAFVADDDPAMGGRKSVIKLGTEAEWWTIQMRDASQMHVWLKAIKAAVAALRDVPQYESSSDLSPPPSHVASTAPTAQTFPSLGRSSLSSSPASSTRVSQTRNAAPPTTAASLKALLNTRRLSVGRRRSPSDPGNGLVETESTTASISGHTLSDSVGPEVLGRRIFDPSSLPPSTSHLSPPRTPSPIKFEAPVVQLPPNSHRHSMSLPPPPRPRRSRPATSSAVPQSTLTHDAERHIDLSDSLLRDTDTPQGSKIPPSPELVLRDLPASAFQRSRISLTSAASTMESDREVDVEQGPAVKHPYGAPNGTTSKSNKRLSTSSALSAGSAASGSGSSRFLRPGYGSGGVPPQRPPPVGSLPPTPGSNLAPASPPPTGPLPTPPSFLTSSSSSSPSPPNASPPASTSIQNRRSVRISLGPANSLPPSLPPSGPLPPTPTTGSRNRGSVSFATNHDSPHSRSSSIRDASGGAPNPRTSLPGASTSTIDGQMPGSNGHVRTDSTSSTGTSGRKRVSLKLRFRNSVTTQHDSSTDPSSSFFMPITPSPGSRSNGESTPTRERGTSFMSPITPRNETSFNSMFSPPIPSPLPSELFTILPGADHVLRSASAPLRSPSFFPPPEQPPLPEHSSLQANELYSSIPVPNRVRAGSLSTLELEPPELKSLSPPPPRRAKRASMSSAAHSTRGSIGSLSGISRQSGESSTRFRGSADSASAIPGVLPGRTSIDGVASSLSTSSRPDSSGSDVLNSLPSTGETTPPHVPADEVPVKPRISMDGELLDGNVEQQKQHSDDEDSYIDAVMPLPLSTTPSYEDERV